MPRLMFDDNRVIAGIKQVLPAYMLLIIRAMTQATRDNQMMPLNRCLANETIHNESSFAENLIFIEVGIPDSSWERARSYAKPRISNQLFRQ